MACAPPNPRTRSTPAACAAAASAGAMPSDLIGVVTTISPTPATRAGTAAISRLETSGAA